MSSLPIPIHTPAEYGGGQYDVMHLASMQSMPSNVKDPTRRYINDLLENPESSLAALFIQYFIVFVILASTGCVVLETVPELSTNPMFFPIEMCITALFTIEFALRFYVCDSLSAFTSSCFNVIDFLAIFPGYVDMIILLFAASQTPMTSAADNMRTLRMVRIARLVRVFRVLRLVKVARHSQMMSLTGAVLLKVSQSGFVVTLMIMCFAMVLSASLVYLSESELCEETGLHCTGPSAFQSIPISFWWAIATLTTVGYGDMVPHSTAGKVVGGMTAIAGVLIVAIGVALVSINFRECFDEEKVRAARRRTLAVGTSRKSRQQDMRDIDDLLRNFDSSSQALLSKLRSISARQDDDSAQQLNLMLDMLASHRSVLTSDIQVFVKGALMANGRADVADDQHSSPRSAS